MPRVLEPAADLAPRVLLPGDPRRALLFARVLLDKPLMLNHARGLWGYTGRAADGELLSIQSTGIGGPSAALIVADLVALGATVLVRAGTCAAVDPGLEDGALIAVAAAVPGDGTSRALGAGGRVSPDPELTDALAAATGRPPAIVLSADLWDGETAALEAAQGVAPAARDLSTATVLRVAELRGVRAAAVLAVAGSPLDEAQAEQLGAAAAQAVVSGDVACR